MVFVMSSRWTGGWVLGLWLAVMSSALGVVATSHMCRQLYAELASLQQQENQLQVEWGQYLLEQSSWASLSRIERQATEKLGMHVPATDKIIMVTP